MLSETGKQIIALHMLCNISRNKGNQAIKSGQLVKHNVRNIFLQNYAKNEEVRLVPDLFFFKKNFQKSFT